MILAEIKNGVVVNVIEVDDLNSTEFLNLGWVDTMGLPAGIGDLYINGKFYFDGQLVEEYIEDDEIIAQELP